MAESLEERILTFLNKQKRGVMADYIARELGVSTNDIYPVLRKLEKQRVLVERDPFAYDPAAAREAEKNRRGRRRKNGKLGDRQNGPHSS